MTALAMSEQQSDLYDLSRPNAQRSLSRCRNSGLHGSFTYTWKARHTRTQAVLKTELKCLLCYCSMMSENFKQQRHSQITNASSFQFGRDFMLNVLPLLVGEIFCLFCYLFVSFFTSLFFGYVLGFQLRGDIKKILLCQCEAYVTID